MPSRNLWSILAFLVTVGTATVGCGGRSICDELEGIACDDCYGELTRCEFDGVEATERSCGDCQARFAVLQELCASGSEATLEEVDAGMTCEPVEDAAADGP
jgi:hypothetical protein